MSRNLSLSALQALVDGLSDAGAAPAGTVLGAARLALGVEAVDARIGGGLVIAAVHELQAAESDAAAAAGFALLLALRAARPGPLVWLREDKARMNGRPYGLGLCELGVDPDRLLLVEAPDTLALLRAGAEAIACTAVSAVIIEPWGKASALDLTATRRLALATARSGVLTLLLRSGDGGPTAAHSRWRVAAAPSCPVDDESPGPATFDITLLRHRSGIAGFDARVEWNRDQRSFGAALSGAAPAAAAQREDHERRPVGTPRRRAA